MSASKKKPYVPPGICSCDCHNPGRRPDPIHHCCQLCLHCEHRIRLGFHKNHAAHCPTLHPELAHRAQRS